MTPTHQHQLLKALHQPQKLQLLTLKHQPLTPHQLKLPRLRNHRLLAACNGLLAGILLSAAGECSPT